MNREELVKELEKLEGQVKEIREKLDKPESVVWKPEIDENYYYVCLDGHIDCAAWDGGSFDEGIYAVSNCYRTEQEAIDARDAKIILTDLQRMADEANGERLREYDEWKKYTAHGIFIQSDGSFDISIYTISAIISFVPCFKTKESARGALNALIEKYTEERVKMALSGAWR